MNSDTNLTLDLKWSVQRALVGNVTANLAGLYAKLDGPRIIVFACFFDKPSDEDRQLTEETAAMVAGDFPENYKLETNYDLISNITLSTLDWEWNFLRAEACQ